MNSDNTPRRVRPSYWLIAFLAFLLFIIWNPLNIGQGTKEPVKSEDDIARLSENREAGVVSPTKKETIAEQLAEQGVASEKNNSKTASPVRQITQEIPELRYDQLKALLYGKNVAAIKSAQIGELSGQAELTFWDLSKATVNYPARTMVLGDVIEKENKEADVTYMKNGGIPEEGFSWTSLIFPLLLIGGLVFFVLYSLRKTQGGMFKGSQGMFTPVTNTMVGFDDVAGCDEAVEEVKECVEFLKYPERYNKLKAKLPSGVLLYGPPGTGKTMIAQAMAHEAGLPFFATSGSDFVEMFVGVGSQRIRELFAAAKNDPRGGVVFIDEIDAIGGKRTSGPNQNEERTTTLNQLLTELSGFEHRERLIVVGATNRLDDLDPALLRPGRLSRQIAVPLPAQSGRKKILEVHAAGAPLGDNVDFEKLSHITAGCSGADLADIINEGKMMAARANRDYITQEDLMEGHLRAIAGPKRADSNISQEEREIIAFHEAGHTLCAERGTVIEKAEHVTIEARSSGAGGFAFYGQKDKALHDSRYFHESLVAILGGRAAEHVVFGAVSSGAANDLEQANSLARTAVQKLGLSPRVGQIVHDENSPFHISDSSKQAVDEEVERLIHQAFEEAVEILENDKLALTNLAQALLDNDTLDRDQIVKALNLEEGTIAQEVSAGTFGVRTNKNESDDGDKSDLPSPPSIQAKRKSETPKGRFWRRKIPASFLERANKRRESSRFQDNYPKG